MDPGRLRENAGRIRERIARACGRSRRDPAGITVVAVTKTVPAATAAELFDLGFADLGENRPLEGARKTLEVGRPARWHFIGHLQTNKVSKVLSAFQVLHSLDREDLAEALERRLDAESRRLPVFVQVNVSGEGSKGGLRPEGLDAFLARAGAEWRHLEILGLMTMAPAAPDPEAARPHFRALRRLASDRGLGSLSMGMTGDFEVALEEGATHLRIGSAFFEPPG